ncbi:MAG: ABC transporter permease [Hyphomicrobiales bacterium]|nr:ABC transporter permease [Hyphomicrobiales bacterium]MBV8826219.1 ABC transporter permease [Hyphomicrobiales bacterium]MBV9427615.1 ABC transporter permease [Bradyrhizobiaceae bacterium]
MLQAFDATTGAAMPHSGAALWLGLRTVRNLRKGLTWAWLDTVCQYRRSKIGPIWETINVLVMTLGIAVVSSAVIGGTVTNLIGYVGLGIIVWTAITSLISEGTTAFVRNRDAILSSNLSIDFYVARMSFRIFITFCHHLILYFIGVAIGLIGLHWAALLAIPGIVLLFVNGFWTITLLSLVCARYRDVELIIRNLLQLAFFVTPVFWDYRHIVSNRRFIVDYNILFYFLEIVRAPLLGEVPTAQTYIVVVSVTVVGYAMAYLVYRRMRRDLAFYV